MHTLRLRLGKAFTLIELLIVITIIGILAVAFVPKITDAPKKARDTTRKAQISQIGTSLEQYMNDGGNAGKYPTGSGFGANTCLDATVTADGANIPIGKYVSYSIPKDPQPNKAITYNSGPSNCTGLYMYRSIRSNIGISDVVGYVIAAQVENTVAGNDSDCFGSAVAVAACDDKTSDLDELKAQDSGGYYTMFALQ